MTWHLSCHHVEPPFELTFEPIYQTIVKQIQPTFKKERKKGKKYKFPTLLSHLYASCSSLQAQTTVLPISL